MGVITRAFQIFGDGETLVLLCEDEVGKQWAIVMKDPVMRSVDCRMDTVQVDSIEDYRAFIPGLQECELTVTASDFEHREGSDLLFELDFFRGKTVKQLLQVVNRKINSRR